MIDCKNNQEQLTQIASFLNPKTIRKLCLKCTLTFIMPTKDCMSGDPDRLNPKMAHFISNMPLLEELSLSFAFLDENWLNMFAEVLTKLAPTLRHLEIISHGELDKQI